MLQELQVNYELTLWKSKLSVKRSVRKKNRSLESKAENNLPRFCCFQAWLTASVALLRIFNRLTNAAI